MKENSQKQVSMVTLTYCNPFNLTVFDTKTLLEGTRIGENGLESRLAEAMAEPTETKDDTNHHVGISSSWVVTCSNLFC